MTTEGSAPKPIQKHIIASCLCGFLSTLLFVIAVLYYTAVGAGAFTAPPPGVGALIGAAVTVLALVPIADWAAHVASRPGRKDIAEMRQALDQSCERALRDAQEIGKWKAIADGIRANPPACEESADVVSILDRLRGGHAN